MSKLKGALPIVHNEVRNKNTTIKQLAQLFEDMDDVELPDFFAGDQLFLLHLLEGVVEIRMPAQCIS